MRVVNSRSIARPEFNAIFRCRTLEGNEAGRCDARRDKPRQLNVNIAKQNEPILKNGKWH